MVLNTEAPGDWSLGVFVSGIEEPRTAAGLLVNDLNELPDNASLFQGLAMLFPSPIAPDSQQ